VVQTPTTSSNEITEIRLARSRDLTGRILSISQEAPDRLQC